MTLPCQGGGVGVILGRVSFDRRKKLLAIVESAGVFLLFLSSYSPDFFMKNLFAQPINNDFTTSIFL